MFEKPEEKEIVQENALAMVRAKLQKQLELLEGRKIDDQDLLEDLNYLNEKLAASVQDLRILVRLLETSRDALILSVAAHDIGEYVRYYPHGKHVIEQLGAKQLVMQYLTHEDPNVRYEALLAVQKLMVHNWEYLGRQLEQNKGKGGVNGVTAGDTK
nr:hypothetical protein BaRGS_002315 [Batillaria attramentaria]